ncbi:MAG: hypothetical protein K5894_01705 [Lachnospiraceae bacterium]|nr:hypothetical protein [Lachnospiraceae bacterium]
MDLSSVKRAEENFGNTINALEEVKEVNKLILSILTDPTAYSEDRYVELMEEKTKLIDRIEALNSESADIYTELSNEMKSGKVISDDLRNGVLKKIDSLNLISADTEKDEKTIRSLMEKMFSKERESIKAAHKNSGAAINYYQTMSESKNVQSMFYDSKN